MCDVEALLLYEVLEVYHKERATLGYDVVHIAGVLERIGELRRSEAVHGVDDDLEREGQCLIVNTLLKEWLEGSIQKRPG